MTNPDIHIGRDGFLFLTGGTNRALDAYRRTPRTSWRLMRWHALLARRGLRARRLGVRFFQAIVPEKLTVYNDRLDGVPLDPMLSPAVRIQRRLDGTSLADVLIDLAGPLRRGRDGRDLFHRTDTHWSPEGCELAYREICRACGFAPVDDMAARAVDQVFVAGDLGEKLDPPQREWMRRGLMIRDARLVWSNAAAQALVRGEGTRHAGAHAVFENPSREAAPVRLLLFGDSYAHVHPFLLTGMLAETVARLDFVWSGSVDWDYVTATRPDILLCETAERFMARVPADRFRVAPDDEPPPSIASPPQTAR